MRVSVTINLKFNLDIGNFLGVNEDSVSSVRRLAHLAVHTHIKDFNKVASGGKWSERYLL